MAPPRRIVLLAALTALYVAAGRFGLTLAFVNQSATAIWPPTGIAVAACLLGGISLWPAVLAGAFLVNLTTTQAVLPSLLIACGNAAEAVLVAAAVQRLAGGTAFLEKSSRILAYVVAAVLAAGVAATVGVAALLAGGLARPPAASSIWITWWTGDLSSALLITPTVVAWARRRDAHWDLVEAVEAAGLVGAVLATTFWVFGPTAVGIRHYPLMFAILPVSLWSALRFGMPGATTSVLATACVATWGTLRGFGPFAGGTPNESLLLLQAYHCLNMIVMLTLAAEVVARRTAERDLRQLNLDLERRIDARSEELQRLHGRLAEAQEAAHVGSWEWDVAADSIWWSDEMYRLYGMEPGSTLAYERFLSLVHPDDRERVQEIVAQSARTGEAFTFEHRAIKPDGTVIVLHSRGRVVTGADGRVNRMLGIGHDVTDRKRAEDERLELVREQAARREAEEANRLKDYFLATLSHELRTPLNAVLGWAQLLQEGAADGELRNKALDAIHRNVNLQAQLVSDILDVAGIRSGTITIDPRPTSLAAVVDGALDIMDPAIAGKDIAVTRNIPGDLAVMGDPRRLQQVCWNLLSNAAKFVERGGSIAITAHQEDSAVMLTIADDGTGIPDGFLPHVFEPFRQADASVTRRHGGLGLGLAISYELIRLHGGRITVANRPGGGAAFTVRLPASPAPASDHAAGTTDSAASPAD